MRSVYIKSSFPLFCPSTVKEKFGLSVQSESFPSFFLLLFLWVGCPMVDTFITTSRRWGLERQKSTDLLSCVAYCQLRTRCAYALFDKNEQFCYLLPEPVTTIVTKQGWVVCAKRHFKDLIGTTKHDMIFFLPKSCTFSTFVLGHKDQIRHDCLLFLHELCQLFYFLSSPKFKYWLQQCHLSKITVLPFMNFDKKKKRNDICHLLFQVFILPEILL